MGTKVQLLAPAGSSEALRAAVENGADAVYLGGREFSARQYAANFGEREIREAIRYCRIRGVKVYVAVNTLLRRSELPRAMEYLLFLRDLGADAVIVQDLGLISCLRAVLPDLEIHASTQMTQINSPGVRLLESWGVRRVVLGRELSLTEIAGIHARAEIGLEVFIHGALCFSYSGQCLMSSMVGGRSGNRGRCSQPCRLSYSLVERGNETPESATDYLLSTRDLSLIEVLPAVIDSGVTALKIEGRMKKPEYVAVVVQVYRGALDRYYRDPDNYRATESELSKLAKVFNRRFTTGYMLGNPGRKLISFDRSNSRGIRLGRVVDVLKNNRVRVRIDADELHKGDEIEFWVTTGGRKEAAAKKIFAGGAPVESIHKGETGEIQLESARGIHSGDRLFKTLDAVLISDARRTFSSPVGTRKLPVAVEARIEPGRPAAVTAADADGNAVTRESRVAVEKAVSRPLTREVVAEHLGRLGNSPFELGSLVCEMPLPAMLPVSELNSLRREFVQGLEELRAGRGLPAAMPADEFKTRMEDALRTPPLKQSRVGSAPALSVSVGDLESVRAAVEAGASRVYFPGEKFTGKEMQPEEIRAAVESCVSGGAEPYISFPRIWNESQLQEISDFLEAALEAGAAGLCAPNLGSVQLLRRHGVKVHADYPLNIFNPQSAALLVEEGADSFCLSPELSFDDMRDFEIDLGMAECLVHGSMPLMVSEHGVLDAAGVRSGTGEESSYALKDRKGYFFPVRADRCGRTYIFNPRELCLIENLPEFLSLGVGYCRIEAGKEDAAYVKRTVRAYREGIDRAAAGELTLGGASLELLDNLSREGFTKGHYFRGVE